MRVLLDTNVILDAMLQRPPWQAAADEVLKAGADGRVTCAATVLSLANIFYVGRRTLGADKARLGVRAYLAAFDIVAIDEDTLKDADALPGADFEDNIQIAAAMRGGLDAVVTRDPSGFAASPVVVLTPDELLQRL
jgi:predicted nucleic acid-binding protein